MVELILIYLKKFIEMDPSLMPSEMFSNPVVKKIVSDDSNKEEKKKFRMMAGVFNVDGLVLSLSNILT